MPILNRKASGDDPKPAKGNSECKNNCQPNAAAAGEDACHCSQFFRISIGEHVEGEEVFLVDTPSKVDSDRPGNTSMEYNTLTQSDMSCACSDY